MQILQNRSATTNPQLSLKMAAISIKSLDGLHRKHQPQFNTKGGQLSSCHILLHILAGHPKVLAFPVTQ